MADTAQDRNLPASARKIQKARGDGQVPRSRDLSHTLAFGLGGGLLVAVAPALGSWLAQRFAAGLTFDVQTLADPAAMPERLADAGLHAALLVLPFGALLGVAAVAAAWLSGGWNFTWKPMQPKLEKIGLIAGIKRLFALATLGDMLKACLLALVLAVIAGVHLAQHLPQYLQLIQMPLPAALARAGGLVAGGLGLLLIAIAVFALVDVPLQRQLLLRRLKMTVEEAKQEHKELEGNTEVKSKIKLRMRERARRRMLAAVPKADLVLMNPTHFAVALAYDEKTMAAPRVVAKGADRLAFRIRDLAEEHSVPVLRSPPLARALYAHAEVDQEIPAALFSAVAQVLAWVYQLRAAVAAGRMLAAPAPEVAVPEGLDPARPEPRP